MSGKPYLPHLHLFGQTKAMEDAAVEFQAARAQQPDAALPTAAAEGQRAPLHA
jgi:hypothetical protein